MCSFQNDFWDLSSYSFACGIRFCPEWCLGIKTNTRTILRSSRVRGPAITKLFISRPASSHFSALSIHIIIYTLHHSLSYLFSLAHFPQSGVDRICHWYQSLLNLPPRAQKMKVLGKEQDEGQRKPRKGKNISLKKQKKRHCYPLTLSVSTFLCDAFASLPKGSLQLYQGAAIPLKGQDIQKGQSSLRQELCCPSSALCCL